MYQSYFSYNITRPYPFRWFTLVVVIGGIVAIALVSFLNVAATGYELYAISSADPNATLSQPSLFKKWPSFIVSTKASCQSNQIPLQTKVYTNNTAFAYTLFTVWTVDPYGQQDKLGSLVYNNQPLKNCALDSLSIDINVDDRTGGEMAVIPVGATVTAIVDCEIIDVQGLTHFRLFTTFDPIPSPSNPSSGFSPINETNKASLWWGESIMRLYWANLMMEFYNSNLNDPSPLYKGVVKLTRASQQAVATAEEVSSIDFFKVSCFFNNINSTGIRHNYIPCDSGHNNISSLSRGSLMPSIWDAVNVLGKATYFSILADLGRNNNSGPNILSDPTLLANLSQNMTSIRNQLANSSFTWGLDSSLAEAPFDPSQATEANTTLGISPAVLVSSYICQVPRLKAGGTLFISVLVADLVLLQGIWMVFKLGVDSFLVKKKIALRSCEGCARMDKALPLEAIDEISEDEPLVEQRL